MNLLDKTTPIDELANGRPALDSEFLEIEVYPDSSDFVLFQNIVNQGIDSHLEGFTRSQFGYRRYFSLGVRAWFKFHRSEIHILLRRLEQYPHAMIINTIPGWIDIIREYRFD